MTLTMLDDISNAVDSHENLLYNKLLGYWLRALGCIVLCPAMMWQVAGHAGQVTQCGQLVSLPSGQSRCL